MRQRSSRKNSQAAWRKSLSDITAVKLCVIGPPVPFSSSPVLLRHTHRTHQLTTDKCKQAYTKLMWLPITRCSAILSYFNLNLCFVCKESIQWEHLWYCLKWGCEWVQCLCFQYTYVSGEDVLLALMWQTWMSAEGKQVTDHIQDRMDVLVQRLIFRGS